MHTTFAHRGQGKGTATQPSAGPAVLDVRFVGNPSDRLSISFSWPPDIQVQDRRDTAKHPDTCVCEFCGHNGTGEFAMREILEGTDGEITEDRYIRFLQLVTERGKAL